MSGINRDVWMAEYDRVIHAPLPETDALSIGEIADLFGIGRKAAEERVKKMIASGVATKTTKQIRRANGGIVSVAAYRLSGHKTKLQKTRKSSKAKPQ